MAFPDIFGPKKKDSAEPEPAPKRDAPAGFPMRKSENPRRRW